MSTQMGPEYCDDCGTLLEEGQIGKCGCMTEKQHVPVGRCPRHPGQSTGNGMFDSPCPLCEMENTEL